MFAIVRISIISIVLVGTGIFSSCSDTTQSTVPSSDHVARTHSRPDPVKPKDLPDANSVVRLVRHRYSESDELHIHGKVTRAMVTLESQKSMASEPSESAFQAWISATQYQFTFRGTNRNQFNLSWKQVLDSSYDPIKLPGNGIDDMIRAVETYMPTRHAELIDNPKAGNMLADTDGVKISQKRFAKVSQALDEVERQTNAEFFTPSTFGYLSGDTDLDRLFGGKSVKVIGEGYIETADCWILESIRTYRSGGAPTQTVTSTPGLMLRTWVDKKTSEIRRIVDYNFVDFALIVSMEERKEEESQTGY